MLGSVPSKCYIYIFIKSSQYVYEALALLLLTRKLSTKYLLKTTQLISVKAGLQAQEFGSRMCSSFFLQLSLVAWVFTTSWNSFTDCSWTAKKIPILAEARISSLPSVWPSAGLTSLHASCHFYTSPRRQWQALLGILAMAEEVALLGVDLLALLQSSSNVELEALHSPPPGLGVERGVFTWSPLRSILDLTWLDFLAFKAWLAWLGFAVGFHNLTGVRLWTS